MKHFPLSINFKNPLLLNTKNFAVVRNLWCASTATDWKNYEPSMY